MRNKLSDLNNHLFEQLERLNDDELTSDQLENEITRTKAMTMIAHTIINNGNLLLNAKRHVDEYGLSTKDLPEVFKLEKK